MSVVSDAALKETPPLDDANGVEAALAQTPPRRRRRTALALLAAGVCACALAAIGAALFTGGGNAAHQAPAKKLAAAPAPKQDPPPLKPHPTVVRAVPPGQAPLPGSVSAGSGTVNGQNEPVTDAEIRREISDFRQHLQGIGARRGPVPRVLPDGNAVAPTSVPDVVATVIAAGNEIATKPYKWGGGHGAWKDSGYDCSGSVSVALAGAGLLDRPLDSTGFMHWGAPGPGRYISIYANAGHAFMVVAGLRFDTSGAQGGTRWQPAAGRSYNGFTVRHPPGL